MGRTGRDSGVVHCSCIGAAALIWLAPVTHASAQTTQPDTAWQHAAWTSAGVGLGDRYRLAGQASVNYSSRHYVITIRESVAAPIYGDGVIDLALLGGVRTDSRHAFLTAGVAHLRPFESSDACGSGCFFAPTTGIAGELGAHMNVSAIGVGATLAGAVGPRRSKFASLTMSVQAGDFGW